MALQRWAKSGSVDQGTQEMGAANGIALLTK
jgi:hypothetical protein